MKTGIQSCGYNTIDYYKHVKELGYECIDYQGFCDTPAELFDLNEADFEKKVIEERHMIADECGLEISQAHGPWRWPPQDATAEQRAERFDKMARTIRGCAIIGCPDMVIHPIMPYGWEQDPEPEKFQDMNLEFMSRLAEIGKEYKIVVNFENMPMPALSLASPAQCLDFVKKINSPWFKICLDTGHCSVLGLSVGDSVRLLGKEYLRTLHVHDNDGAHDFHWLPYTGVIDWEDFSNALAEIGFEGSVSLETFVPRNFPNGPIKDYQEKSLYLCARKLAKQD